MKGETHRCARAQARGHGSGVSRALSRDPKRDKKGKFDGAEQSQGALAPLNVTSTNIEAHTLLTYILKQAAPARTWRES